MYQALFLKQILLNDNALCQGKIKLVLKYNIKKVKGPYSYN